MKSKNLLFVIVCIVFLILACPMSPEGDSDSNDGGIEAPSDLQVRPISATEVELTWKDNSDNEAGFRIEISEDNVNFILVTTTPPNTTSWIVGNLSPGVTYYFRVKAFSAEYQSGYTERVFWIFRTYSGTLELRFSNTFPAFDETTQITVEIDSQGSLDIGTGTLSYLGEDDNGEAKIKRDGDLALEPYGEIYACGGGTVVSISENTDYSEHYQHWYWDDDAMEWILDFDINPSGTWNGGLAFDLDEAMKTGGHTVGVQNAQGAVLWTLELSSN